MAIAPLLPRVGGLSKLFKPTVAALIPVTLITEFVEGLDEGKNVAEAATVAILSGEGAYVGAVLGGFACGAVTTGTAGIGGALACGALVLGGTAVGGAVGELLGEGVVAANRYFSASNEPSSLGGSSP